MFVIGHAQEAAVIAADHADRNGKSSQKFPAAIAAGWAGF
jgi:hypothetical protein